MRVVQVYLPTVITDTIVYNGFSQPVLRYYERLIAAHITPVLYKDIKRSGWEKFKLSTKRIFKRTIADMSYDRALIIAFAAVVYALSRKYPWAKKFYKQLAKWFGRYNLPKESSSMLESFYITEGDESLFTEIILDKKKLKIQFVSIPLEVSEIQNLFSKFDSNQYIKSAKQVMFSSLSTLDIYDDVDIKALVLTVPCVICSIEEVEDIQTRYEGKEYSIIVVDTVNEVIYSKLKLYGREFKYSVPLREVIRKKFDTELTIDRLTSVLQGVKLRV